MKPTFTAADEARKTRICDAIANVRNDMIIRGWNELIFKVTGKTSDQLFRDGIPEEWTLVEQSAISCGYMAPLKMRAKMKINSVTLCDGYEQIEMHPVCKPTSYPADSGLDEDNSFARFSPSGELKLAITNPALHGKFKPGQTFYVDFTECPTTKPS